MTPAEEMQIRSLNETLTREVTIGMLLTDDPRSRDIEGILLLRSVSFRR